MSMRSLVVFFGAITAACSDGSTIKTDAALPDEFDRRAMLAHLSANVLLPIQANVATKTAPLPGAILAYCDALDAGTVGTTLDTARAALGDAIDSWQYADAVLVGPAAMDQKAIRDRLYAWPLISPCELNKDIASQWANPASYDVNTELVSTRSLTSIEFLLYPPSDAHACLTAPAGWDTIPKDRARCRLAAIIAADVANQAQVLHTAWKPDGGNYGATLAGMSNAHTAVNLVSDALFYTDKMIKDMKLGQTAGIAMNVCDAMQEPCVAEVESRFADRGTFAIRANLTATRQVFTGTTTDTEGPSFDDFLVALGHQDVATRMVTNLDAAIAAADALPDSFLSALSTSYTQVVATHAATKAFTDDLKSQFLTLLALEIPDDVATDND
jgi:predicted lipoprotein